MTWIMSKSLALLQWVRFGRRRGSQPTVAMPSVAEAEPAEFAETAATLALQIERFFWGGSGVGGTRIRACGPIGLPVARARMYPPLSQR